MPASVYTQKKTKGCSYMLERQTSAELKDSLLIYSTFLALLWKTTIITGRKFINKFEKQMFTVQ